MSSRQEMQRLIKDLQQQGFNVQRTGSGHWMVRPPEGEGCVVLAFSPRSGGFQKSLTRLRKLGYK